MFSRNSFAASSAKALFLLLPASWITGQTSLAYPNGHPAVGAQETNAESEGTLARGPSGEEVVLSLTDPLDSGDLLLESEDARYLAATAGSSDFPPDPNPGHRVNWDPAWPTFRNAEYVLTAAALAGVAVNFFLIDPPTTTLWRGGILFDDDVRRALRIDSESGRDTFTTAADLTAYFLVAYPIAVDAGAVAWWRDHNPDVAWQLLMIDAEAFAFTEAVNALTTNLVRRHRPRGNVCDPDSSYDPGCVKSFVSGHAANMFTGAGLICAQHQALPLYGGGAADSAACATSLVVATAGSVARIASNDHYATDVLAGAAVGLFAGYVLPNLLHFHFGQKTLPRTTEGKGTGLGLVMPMLGQDAYGLSYVRAW